MQSQQPLKEALTVVIPVYNEERSIETVITGWHHSLKRLNIDHDIIVINDGSTDSTSDILNGLSDKWSFLHVTHQENAGHGAAIRHGYGQACSMNNKYIFQTDSDHQFTPADFDKFWAQRENYRAVFGLRADRQDPPARKFISGILKKMIFDLYTVDIPDANIPYRLFHRNYLRNLLAVVPTNAFAPNIFLSLLCYKTGESNTTTIPVTHFDRPYGNAKLLKWGLLKACFSTFKDVLSFTYSLPEKIDFVETKFSQDQENEQRESQAQGRPSLRVA